MSSSTDTTYTRCGDSHAFAEPPPPAHDIAAHRHSLRRRGVRQDAFDFTYV
jgi:hypothetical protein